jgi:hypothetical protein
MDAWGAHLGHGVYLISGKLIWRYNYHYGDRGSTQAGGGAGSAVRLASTGGAQVYSNTFSNDGGRRYWGMMITGGTNNIYNNTFNGNNYGIRTEGGTNVVSNNVFLGVLTANWSTNSWYYIYRAGGSYSGDHNQWFGASNGWSWQNGLDIATLAGWQAASSQDANSVSSK